MAKTMKFILRDDPSSGKVLRGKIVKEGGGLGIYIDGFGNDAALPGKAPVAGLVLQDGHLRLVTFPDHTNEEHVTVDLDGAKLP